MYYIVHGFRSCQKMKYDPPEAPQILADLDPIHQAERPANGLWEQWEIPAAGNDLKRHVTVI